MVKNNDFGISPFRVVESNVLSESDYVASVDISLPVQVTISFGCHNNDWRLKWSCPYGGEGEPEHPVGLCPEREQFLKNLYGGKEKNPSYAQWLESYNHFMMNHMQNKEWKRLYKISDDLEKLERKLSRAKKKDDNEEVVKSLEIEVHRITKLYRGAKAMWMELTREVNKTIQNTLTRETPKKLDITKRVVTPGDVSKLMRHAEIIDVIPEK